MISKVRNPSENESILDESNPSELVSKSISADAVASNSFQSLYTVRGLPKVRNSGLNEQVTNSRRFYIKFAVSKIPTYLIRQHHKLA